MPSDVGVIYRLLALLLLRSARRVLLHVRVRLLRGEKLNAQAIFSQSRIVIEMLMPKVEIKSAMWVWAFSAEAVKAVFLESNNASHKVEMHEYGNRNNRQRSRTGGGERGVERGKDGG